jgi:hypothetical protein
VAEEQTRLRADTVSRIEALFRAAAPNADDLTIAVPANVLSGAAEQVERWWRQHPKTSREVLVDQLVAFAWRGLEPLARA